MKRIGILGGTFDPPHIGHLLIAEEVRIALSLDKVWFIPSSIPPHKQEAFSTANNRIAMVRKAIQNNTSFKVKTLEVERVGKSYTIDTINVLKDNYPNIDFYFIIGADMVEYLPKWHKIEELLALVTFVGVNRLGFTVESTYPILNVEVPSIDVSSTLIRNRIMDNVSVNYLLPELVYDYIKENRLYEKR